MYKKEAVGKQDLEDVCYEYDHIDTVWSKMETVLPKYFSGYLETEKGSVIEEDKFEELKNKFNGNSSFPTSKKSKNNGAALQRLSEGAIDVFLNDKNDDRQVYIKILDPDYLEECRTDYNDFKKSDLRNKIPIIRKTLSSKKKELDKYKMDFNNSDPKLLLEIIFNIIKRSKEFDNYDEIDYLEDEKFYDYDYDDDYTYFKVIGNGIKSHFLYELNPKLFPNRSRNAIFSLWYLVDKEDIDCKEGSEFLMIDSKKNTTQENYYYPYCMFAHYASLIADYLRKQFAKYNVKFDETYRFVYVNDFLEYISNKHSDEIEYLKGFDYGC